MTATPLSTPPQSPIGRIPVLDVEPLVDGGARPTKCVVGEQFLVSATVLREGHDAVGASVVLTDPDGVDHVSPMVCTNPGLNAWEATVAADRPGMWTFRVEGWSDPFGTWEHDATIKVQADVDTDLMLAEGALFLERAAESEGRSPAGRDIVLTGLTALTDDSRPPLARLSAVTHGPVHEELTTTPVRDLVSPSTAYPLLVERELALTGAWYEFFPRSEGAVYDDTTHEWRSGTLRTAAKRLTAVAGMGFDVIYLTPIHPIGQAAKKGPNNTLDAGPEDPGSPYAIGSPDGGHDAIHPDLGTFDDFDAFVAEARRLGLEVAMDIALQCSPDHPWVKEHPEWFTTRADGTIAFAENPPKKYQDIYPLNFDNDPAGAYAEMRRMVQVWIDHGVTLFRVDNPHTKPVEFWQWLIQDVARDHPEIIWLSEAFTKPAMMRTLAKVGFQQSYTYYAWRNTKPELQEYVEELATETAHYMRPSFWPTTHDILTPYMQFGGPAAWKLRAALAGTLVPTYGIYAGYELMEHVARPGAEEQIDNEKYQYKNRHWEDYEPGGSREGQSLAWYLRRLNEIRRAHPALHWLRNITFHHVDDENIMAFSKRRVVPADPTTGAPEHEDVVIVIANLDPHSTRWSRVVFDMPAMGLHPDEGFRAHDLITDQWWDFLRETMVHLGPDHEPVHIIELKRY
ncbi:alpha-1,4-glucan:maltose-1-phosphate maltosyltransferase [Knoellia flava TL1]|uniref:Alpha-1,4-glucan:maltose-1-phosphate maltosyltransferase n=2 Tax=Knoellia flava TaxID=913969 RepID=A0A8H9FRK6_9MICO|nr:alpha-1,4-glucan--maltose-1-phosphate maltosyltransferase [Knoellia flava]KGN28928.1 alpha-1,4-glucan:maltose-1-phosphate maltosyltransferase [Knoellia flava TL1]GGB71596.1 alpha-1,4-glucan:maltose-1-phosphate maltosyltransferase [Knoellia flava]